MSELYIESKTLFLMWTGKNEMSEPRKNCLEQLISVSGCNVVLITPDNLSEYILPDHPLHEAYPYLSETHKADYLRTYFMHFHGGGYSDIKYTSGNWNKAFDEMKQNPSCLINGYKEIGRNGVGHDDYRDYWEVLVGNCAYIVRPRTEFTTKWYSALLSVLDKHLTDLRKYPAKNPQAVLGDGTNYPLRWTETLGEIFHKILVDSNFTPRSLYSVPIPHFHNYR